MIKRYNKNQINELAEILNKNGVISVPTDTVFGLCAKIDSKIAHDKLMRIKQRPENKLLPVMCADEEQIKSIAIVDKKVEQLIQKHMPGPITLILKKRDGLPEYVNNGKTTIAVRMATSDILGKLIKEVGCPLFMSSANLSGKPACKNLDEIEKQCPDLDGMLEGGVSFGISSTIVDCTTEEFKIIREGPIKKI